MFTRQKLGMKMLIAFLVVGVTPFAVIGTTSLIKSNSALKESTFNHLTSVREIKKLQISDYFKTQKDNMAMLMETVHIMANDALVSLDIAHDYKKKELEEYFEKTFLDLELMAGSSDVTSLYADLLTYHDETQVAADAPFPTETPVYKGIMERHNSNISKVQRAGGYTDILLVSAAHGQVMYSAAGKKDLGSNLVHGPLRQSALAGIWEKTLKSQTRSIVDFTLYGPSDNEPAAFVGVPIERDARIVGVMVVQLSLARINTIMGQRIGLGRSGESYLVGADRLLRSDHSLLYKEKDDVHTVRASFANPDQGRLESEAIRRALAGEHSSHMQVGHEGQPVFAAFAPLSIMDLNWAIIAEIDIVEVLNPRDTGGDEYFAKYVKHYDYHDLFLITVDGFCSYSVAKEDEYRSNLSKGKYRDSGLGKIFKAAMESKQFAMSDFAPYAPSGNEPAAFMAQAIVHNGEAELVVAVQLSMEGIDNIMQQRAGLGDSGETYLVGPDKLMRSDSFLDPDHHSILASFADPLRGSVNTVATNEALDGKTDTRLIIDYNGNPVLSAYTPVQAGDVTWALVAEIDKKEAFAPVNMIMWLVGTVFVIGVIFIVLLALLITRSITAPLKTAVDVANRLGMGDVDVDITVEGKDELGQLLGSMQDMASAMKKTAETADQVAIGDLPADIMPRSDKDIMGNALKNMVAAMKSNAETANMVADGDLTVTVTPRSENDIMNNALESMISNLRNQTREIKDGANVLATSIGEILSSTSEFATSATQMATSVDESTTTVEEVRRTAINANDTAEKVVAAAKEAEQISQQGQETTDNAKNGMLRIKEQMDVISESIVKLSEQSQAVGEIISTVEDLADQSNLLAVNASIEAIRAGEHGKSFSVVAQEIRGLSEQSKQSTKAVRSILNDTQQAISRAVMVTEQGRRAVEAGVKQSSEAGEAISLLGDSIAKSAQSALQISSSSRQQMAGMDQIIMAMENIKNASEQNAAGSSQMEKATLGLRDLSEKLKQLVEHYKV